jgi:hypothetical protein
MARHTNPQAGPQVQSAFLTARLANWSLSPVLHALPGAVRAGEPGVGLLGVFLALGGVPETGAEPQAQDQPRPA